MKLLHNSPMQLIFRSSDKKWDELGSCTTEALLIMSEDKQRSALLSRTAMRKRSSILSTRERLIELRPKGTVVVVASDSPTEFKRKQHAQAQKQQRDRLKTALDRIARIMEGRGVQAGTGGSKAELVEAAVKYIQSLQGEIEQLRVALGTRQADWEGPT
ncbi:uncharacterized protein APUU_31261A [Aspergillus puulaauensis]|uniref:BHLH domain-containing protein n=1 Tax=Aspergillus puulaauensis TaxID=1220207 RepID=A0A7R8AL92_9EURO|nr:uncharacterized protein APUU_31261A [Aspergillus puulaauensis]BCS23036.1 hypothetical protein APUU_31261A [Aspergillus puulaauensis]